jgi:two-component system response regulator TrcR
MSRIKVLLVEDEIVLASIVKETLDSRGFDITIAKNGVEGWSAFKSDKPDVMILDVMMPRKDGFSLAEDVRKVDQAIPLIFLTAKSTSADVIRGLEIGADDYIKKPFVMEELILRLKALHRRATVQGSDSDAGLPDQTRQVGQYHFDYHRLELSGAGRAISLSQREADLLKLLTDHKNALLERRTALITIWGDDTLFNARNMDVYITRIRKYLADDPSIQIQNIRGFGYKLID